MNQPINKFDETYNLQQLINKRNEFNETDVLHQLKHYLPTQTPLKDFIHHNSLHAFQDLKFYEAIFKASKIFGYQVTLQLNNYRNLFKINRIKQEVLDHVIKERKGDENYKKWYSNVVDKNYTISINPRIGKLRANWKNSYKIDLDNLVQPLLFRIICSYLDQGVAVWHFPFENKGLINAIRELEKNSFSSFFKTKRAKQLLFDKSTSIETLLKLLVGDEAFFEQYLFDQQFGHKGWSGIVSSIEDKPNSILYSKEISLKDFILFELLLEVDALDYQFGENKWQPMATKTKLEHVDLFADIEFTELNEVLTIWQEAFEWSYYDQVISVFKEKITNYATIEDKTSQKTFQGIFCIDERECSFRRYIEDMDSNCETFGSPGFFGVEFYFHPTDGKFYDKLCPAPVTPKYLIKERESKIKRKNDILYTKKSHKFFEGFAASLSLGAFAGLKLFSHIFNPKMTSAVPSSFAHMDIDVDLTIENKNLDDRENDLQIGFTVTEMANRVEALLRSIGLIENFAPLVYIVSHGSSTANNPHHGAYECGACSGRPGSVNARVVSFMANHPEVRKILSERGLNIPESTQFLGALHDTSRDEVAFYDEKFVSAQNQKNHQANKLTFEKALGLNAKERSRRFVSIDTRKSISAIKEAVKKRSVSFFQPRPELGHCTNALCVVGNRSLTKDLFLDRRAFMNSYDYRTDPEGKILLNVMKPLIAVCGGINLEYYFSKVDNYKLGAGSKLPHNVMGLVGVANSSDGDLRPGLPLQMIEMHDPVRLLTMVEHYPEVILKKIQEAHELYEWFINDWVHLIAIHPETHEFHYFKDGEFKIYKPINTKISKTNNVIKLIESTKKAGSNNILETSIENLPVHIITKE